MIKTLIRTRWICPQCNLRQQQLKRSIATATTPVQRDSKILLASHAAPGETYDDRTLRQIFDSSPFWKEFSNLNRFRQSRTGLFQNKYLTSPDGFQSFANSSLRKAQKIVAKVLKASTLEEYANITKDLDRLSDLLCRVIDLSDFIRSVHPDRRIQAAATQAYALMFEYMNVLNTTPGLNDRLKEAASNQDIISIWSEEEKIVAQILIRDFSKSAIDLPDEARQKFVKLSNDISELGPDFVDNMTPATKYVVLESSKLKGMDPTIVKKLTSWGKVTIPSVGPASILALRTVEDENVRRDIYMASRTSSSSQIERLEALLKKRAELAKLSGFTNFAHMTLGDKMAQSQESVNSFLTALWLENRPRVGAEFSELLKLKQRHKPYENSATLKAWDKDYYTTRLLSASRSKSRNPDFLSSFFSLGTVMQGLSRLFTRLYGIRLVPRETQEGETWNDDVRRLDVVDENEGHIAVVYCDLFEREGKSPNPAHFTVRCSRLITEEEVEEAAADEAGFDSAEDAANDGMASRRDANGQLFQLPIIALICDFSVGSKKKPTLLHFREVQTLFHEMGHAIHSIVGRTTLQNVAGTRCATDFAELPSVLMEHFAAAPEVLGLFARHWETDAALPYQMVKEKVFLDRKFEGAEVEMQIMLSMLDQAYHSSAPLLPDFNSSRVYHEMLDTHATLQEPEGTSWQGFFGHLFGYGGTYYSYLFDRAIANKVWKDVFQKIENGAVSREAGTHFREQVLKWGGSKDPWVLIAGALQKDELAPGGQEAMTEVGRWGVKD